MTDQRSTEQLREDISRQREQLGETVGALAHKADVPARAREKSEDLRVAARQEPAKTGAVVGGALLAVVAVFALMRSRKKRK